MKRSIGLMVGILAAALLFAQEKRNGKNPVYVDKQGVLRWTHNRSEAAFFGVNYTVPFAYGYRSHKALSIDPEKAIDTDVAHMARLGLDAFRVHVWDTEITDSAGNLLQNDHLRLFDYLLMRLKEKGIKILITPLAFWGSGYPEPDQNTGSFSSKYNKRQVLVTPEAIAAQENYLRQFFRHVNPYTKTTYGNDPDVIAMEINNEPHHSGPKEAVTTYINRMAAAVRSTGWSKPVFYNISESPAYADAVVKAEVDGHSFQWYPTGLVANRTLEGNYLPNVDGYRIPFSDTIPAFEKRARMVYEFDAGDVLGAYMYPAMARSFRQAGFQWATQFAYDPLFTAHNNTEYQTHYLNLAYTPSKAISLMIAGKVFHRLPRFQKFGTHPADTTFGGFRVSYAQNLSELNSSEEFYYANTTGTSPVNPAALRHVAGVGSSAVAAYDGTGAYFLDRVRPGVWRLEVLPDVFQVADPFGKAAPDRTVRRLLSNSRSMTLNLPDLGANFSVTSQNTPARNATGGTFSVTPGIYYLVQSGTPYVLPAPEPFAFPTVAIGADSVIFNHTAADFLYSGFATIAAEVAGADSVLVELRHAQAGWKTIALNRGSGFYFDATLPKELQIPGILEYRFLARDKKGVIHSFPGGAVGDPYRWDAPAAQTWQALILDKEASIPLFDAATHKNKLTPFTTNWQEQKIEYTAGNSFPFIWQVLQATAKNTDPLVGWQLHLNNQLPQAQQAFSKLLIKAKGRKGTRLHLALIDKNATSFVAHVDLSSNEEQWYQLPLNSFMPGRYLLLPRPYPGFQPLFFEGGAKTRLNSSELDKLQVWISNVGTEGHAAAALQTILIAK